MRAVLQRVSRAKVLVGGETVGAIGKGILILLGISRDDTEKDAIYLLEKILHLRIFEDAAGKMNLSLLMSFLLKKRAGTLKKSKPDVFK
jgi:D-tyrosyl-tRNA(Tyr) deacylase